MRIEKKKKIEFHHNIKMYTVFTTEWYYACIKGEREMNKVSVCESIRIKIISVPTRSPHRAISRFLTVH